MAEKFTEIYVEGDNGIVRGFVAGFLGGARADARILVNADHGVADDGIARQMAERMHLVETVTHLIADDRLRDPFLAVIEQDGGRLGIRSCGTRAIRQARLPFDWQVFSPEEAIRVRRLFENERPASIELEGYAPEQSIHDEKGGTGMYAPAHSFVVKAAGCAFGPPDDLVDWAKRLRTDDFVHVRRIELDYTDDVAGGG